MRKTKQVFQERGIAGVLEAARKRERSIDIYRLDLEAKPDVQKNMGRPRSSTGGDVRVRILEWKDLPVLDEYIARRGDGDLTRGLVESMLEQERICFVALQGSRVLGSTWLGFGRGDVGALGVSMAVGRDQAYSFKTHVLAEARNNGIARLLLQNTFQYAKAGGYLRLFAAIYAWNVPSIKVYSELGYEKIGTVRAWKRLLFRGYEFRPCNGSPKIALLRKSFYASPLIRRS